MREVGGCDANIAGKVVNQVIWPFGGSDGRLGLMMLVNRGILLPERIF